MSDIEKIQEKLKQVYGPFWAKGKQVPLVRYAIELGSYAKEYISAASIVDSHGPQLMLARLQLTGLAVELALKTYLAAAGVRPPKKKKKGHDLIRLYKQASQLGLVLAGPDQAAIVHLSHLYYQDLATETVYKARYPAETDEPLGGAVPESAEFDRIVGYLLKMAAEKNQQVAAVLRT